MKDELELKNELRKSLTLIGNDKLIKLKNINQNYPAYVIRKIDNVGVAIEVAPKLKGFSHSFEKIKIIVEKLFIENEEKYYLELITMDEENIEQFLLFCINFIYPGENGENRKEIIDDPDKLCERWESLLGNKKSKQLVYDCLGELIVFDHLLGKGEVPFFTKNGSHDIETKVSNYEVKTTTLRYTSNIEIHSKYQLLSLNDKKLYLYFVRLEESLDGVSINSIIEKIEKQNINIEKLKEKVKNFNSIDKDKRYKIDEIRSYEVNDNFPRIVEKDFINGKLPNHIVSIKYSIDLDGVEYQKIV